MKFVNAKTIAALALTGALSVGTASAMGLNTGIMPVDSIAGVSSSNISVKVDNGVATLFGYVDSSHESALAQAHVEQIDGVDRVINLIIRN